MTAVARALNLASSQPAPVQDIAAMVAARREAQRAAPLQNFELEREMAMVSEAVNSDLLVDHLLKATAPSSPHPVLTYTQTDELPPSLNASVAAALAEYQVARKRQRDECDNPNWKNAKMLLRLT